MAVKQVYGSGIDQVMAADLARSNQQAQEVSNALALMGAAGERMRQQRNFEQTRDEQKRQFGISSGQRSRELDIREKEVEARRILNDEYKKAQIQASIDNNRRNNAASTLRTLEASSNEGNVDPNEIMQFGWHLQDDPITEDIGLAAETIGRGIGAAKNEQFVQAKGIADAINADLDPFNTKIAAATAAMPPESSFWSIAAAKDRVKGIIPWMDSRGELQDVINEQTLLRNQREATLLKNLGPDASVLTKDPSGKFVPTLQPWVPIQRAPRGQMQPSDPEAEVGGARPQGGRFHRMTGRPVAPMPGDTEAGVAPGVAPAAGPLPRADQPAPATPPSGTPQTSKATPGRVGRKTTAVILPSGRVTYADSGEYDSLIAAERGKGRTMAEAIRNVSMRYLAQSVKNAENAKPNSPPIADRSAHRVPY